MKKIIHYLILKLIFILFSIQNKLCLFVYTIYYNIILLVVGEKQHLHIRYVFV